MLLSVNVFVSLDGVMQGPGNPDEDRSDGFDRGGWVVPFASAHTSEVVEGWFREAGAFLFGRTSYGLLGGYWSRPGRHPRRSPPPRVRCPAASSR
ncbi:hypothetical protein [Actinoplanes sp. NPDC048796]|uniref:hypothetical protein n=1 Tax=unclassified Actinoplanes TaxID=2626549 RepID=UPI0033C5AD9F